MTSEEFPELEKEQSIEEMEEEIKRLRSEADRMAKMFAENTYIESATMEPGLYNINLRGQGAMLIIGQLIKMFRDSGGKNFHTSTLQISLPDSKTRELFELTIQKVNGADSPAMKIQRLTEEAKAKDARIAELEESMAVAYFLGGKKQKEANWVLIDYIKRLEEAFLEAMDDHGLSIAEARAALERIKAGGKDDID